MSTKIGAGEAPEVDDSCVMLDKFTLRCEIEINDRTWKISSRNPAC